MVFYNPSYPALSRTLKRARERERYGANKRRKTMAATTIQRAYRTRRSYASKVRLQTGESTARFPCKLSTVKSDGFVSRATNDLIEVNPLNVARATTANQDLNTRQGDVIYLAGFKINLCFRNTRTTANTDAQLYLNVALVSTKAGTDSVSTLDFFTSGGGTTRSYNFDNVNYTTLERHLDPINSDRYAVHWHERYTMDPWALANSPAVTTGSVTARVPNTTSISKFIPIKRQIRFDSSSASSADPEFRVLFWVGIPGEGYSDPFVTTADQFKSDHSITAYYRDP